MAANVHIHMIGNFEQIVKALAEEKKNPKRPASTGENKKEQTGGLRS